MDATQAPPAIDASPHLAALDPPADVLYFVLIKGFSRWSVFTRKNGEQATATTIEEAESLLTEAKRHVEFHSKASNLAASGLRIAVSTTEEL